MLAMQNDPARVPFAPMQVLERDQRRATHLEPVRLDKCSQHELCLTNTDLVSSCLAANSRDSMEQDGSLVLAFPALPPSADAAPAPGGAVGKSHGSGGRS